jgi:hypothetical protein
LSSAIATIHGATLSGWTLHRRKTQRSELEKGKLFQLLEAIETAKSI